MTRPSRVQGPQSQGSCATRVLGKLVLDQSARLFLGKRSVGRAANEVVATDLDADGDVDLVISHRGRR